ncbi:YeiH family protein [Pseudalkalibacillus sp. A8]|uniref:YeiH family protein n=1 Tax=Pseudalkalibacillus sp. A8 TaxID=3382641 RepID=UPI0038B66349
MTIEKLNEHYGPPSKENKKQQPKYKELIRGIALTVVLATVAGQIATFPFFSIMGTMILSILLGTAWKGFMGTQQEMEAGIAFSSKVLLRIGIILMGLRLNLSQIIDAGISILIIDAIVIGFTMLIMIGLGKILKVDNHLAALIAIGTAVCGAAAIVAVAPVIKVRKEYIALAVACIAILGTFGAIGYIFTYPFLDMDAYLYGVLVGSTLHELAHVIAASIPGGEVGSKIAILVKLGRVALLIPVVIILGFFFSKKESEGTLKKRSFKDLPIPWFIFGFLAMSILNTLQWIPNSVTHFLIMVSVFLISMAMAGLGLSINISDFKKVGVKPVLLGVIGFILLICLGPILLLLL